MNTMHHAHLMATDIEATIEFWRRGFGANVAYDTHFAGVRNVFLQLGGGHIHLYQQRPRAIGQGTVHHLGVQTNNLDTTARRIREMGYSVTAIRREPTAAYAMVKGPDDLLVEVFEPDISQLPPELRSYFGLLA